LSNVIEDLKHNEMTSKQCKQAQVDVFDGD